ncbi:MAG: Na+/Pi-cotransporter [Parcubacteria group bacterium GW2011_GWF2_38_76]|nr:MAG: Na+/Pi-cotransporter [Parcubacteria group bacterium GW2011_GWF2_38_76]HBM45977.1 hypothetical protein [Patescibacteria group bacterium]
MLINTFFTIIASVILFLFSIKKFSKQIHNLGGDKIKKTLEIATMTPLRGVATGAILTAIVQSSTAVTIILVGLVDVGVITFYNSLGVILGANIGTTLTSQLVAFKIIYFAPYLVVLSFLLEHTNSRYQKYAKAVFYFGLVFLSLFFIMIVTEPLQRNPFILGIFSNISNIYLAVLAGIIATVILQSSSVVSGILILLVAQGFFDFNQAFGIILGANIGTTSTAMITSLIMNASAKKTAIAHLLFNVIGVLLFIPFINRFSAFIDTFQLSSDKSVALAYLLFNLINATLFIFFLNYFHQLINKVYRVFYKSEE